MLYRLRAPTPTLLGCTVRCIAFERVYRIYTMGMACVLACCQVKAADAAEKRVQSKAPAARVRQLLARGAPGSAVSARSEAPAAPVARVSQVRGGLVV